MRRLLICLLAFAGSLAMAQEGAYVGIGIGELDYEEQFEDPILGTVGDSVTSYKLMGGFEVNDFFAIEISYGKDDSIQQSATRDLPPLGTVSYWLDIDVTKTALRAVGRLPLDSFALIAGLGYFSADTDFAEYIANDVASASGEGSYSDDGLMAQLGVEWRFGRFGASYALRLEYEWWDMTDVDASTIGLAFLYGF